MQMEGERARERERGERENKMRGRQAVLMLNMSTWLPALLHLPSSV